MRRHVYLLLGFLMMVLVFGLWGGFSFTRQHAPTLITPFSTVGTPAFTEARQYADLVLLLDQSASMSTGKLATDPTNLRVAGSLAGIDFLASHATDSRKIRFGLVHFGSTVASDSLPLTDVTALQRAEAGKARQIIRPLQLGETNIIAALRQGTTLLDQPPAPDTKRVMVLFTDGDPVDARKLNTPQYFAELRDFAHEDLASKDIELYVIGIDARGERVKATLPYWQQITPKDHLFHVTSMQGMKTAFNTIAQRLWRLPAGSEATIAASAPVQKFIVPPYIERMECFVFSQSAPYRMTLTRPDGTIVVPGKYTNVPAVQHQLACDQLTVNDPPPGEWSCRMECGKPVRVVRNLVPLHLKLVSPTGEQPAGKPVTLTATFTKADGTPVPIDPEHPVEAMAEIKAPGDEKAQTVSFPPKEMKDGMLCSEPVKLPNDKTGEMSVDLKTKVDGKLASEQPVSMPITQAPYLQPNSDAVQQLAKENGISVSTPLMQNGLPMPTPQAKAVMKDYQAFAQLYDPTNKQVIATAEMKFNGKQLTARLPVPLKQMPRGVLLMSLAKKAKGAKTVTATDTAVVPLTPAVLAPVHPITGPAAPARPLSAAWGTLGIILLTAIGVVAGFVLFVLNYQRLLARFVLHQGPMVYYWPEHHANFQFLELGDQRKCHIASLGLRVTCDPAGLYHVRADSADVLYTADDKPAHELTYRDRLELIVSMGELCKIRLRLASHEGRIARPPKYGTNTGGKTAKWA